MRDTATRGFGRFVLVLLPTVVALVGGCGSVAPSSSPGNAASAVAGGPTPVILDVDGSSDDTLATLWLLREPSVDLRAITVSGTGLVHCAPGLQAVANLLATLEVEDLPIGCGSETALGGGHPFPDDWRARADAGYGLALERGPVPAEPVSGPDLMAEASSHAPGKVTLIELGPMTNLATALRAHPDLAGRIDHIVAMAGAIDVDGNVDLGAGPTRAEWNVYADPVATDEVVRSRIPLLLVPLDATNAAVVTSTFIDTLGEDHAAAGADVAYELLLRGGLPEGESFWDPMAVAIGLDETLARIDDVGLRVMTEGTEAGRTARAVDGTPVRVATRAHRPRFEAAFLAGLRQGAPRVHPFALAGTLAVAFDGTTCALTRPDAVAPGVWSVDTTSSLEAQQSFVALLRFHDGSGWDDLVAYIATAPTSADPPGFADVTAFLTPAAGAPASAVASLEPGLYAVVCVDVRQATPAIALTDGPISVAP